MGRRSINTTKSGKYMNPTDQARKEARKKELKKNKRQRQMVRAAVLKNKDPAQILEEMEKIDEMEYNCLQPSPLNEKVLRDKRKKLRETFDRVMRLYHTDEQELWSELKRKEVEYEKKRLKKQQYYESVKHAQSVQIDDIPLPSSTQAGASIPTVGLGVFTGTSRLPPPPTALSLPPFAPGAPPGAVKKLENMIVAKETAAGIKRQDRPPGVPPCPPPDLFAMPDLDSDNESSEVVLKEYNPKQRTANPKVVSKPNSLQQRMLAISGQNIDEFMKEMENVHKKKEKERAAAIRGDDEDDNQSKDSDNGSNEDDNSVKSESTDDDSDSNQSAKQNRVVEKFKAPQQVATTVSIPLPPVATTVPPPPQLPIPGTHIAPAAGLAPSMLYRPPPLRPPGMFVPRPPVMPGIPPPRMGIRMPPGPPPGLPPRLTHHHHKNPQPPQQHKDPSKGVTIITAKPQIRNLSADVTRFVPSTLRVKREESRKPGRTRTYAPQAPDMSKTATKDDAYMQFINEMQGLL